MKNGFFNKDAILKWAINYIARRIEKAKYADKVRMKCFLELIASELAESDRMEAADRGEYDLDEVGGWL